MQFDMRDISAEFQSKRHVLKIQYSCCMISEKYLSWQFFYQMSRVTLTILVCMRFQVVCFILGKKRQSKIFIYLLKSKASFFAKDQMLIFNLLNNHVFFNYLYSTNKQQTHRICPIHFKLSVSINSARRTCQSVFTAHTRRCL